MPRGRPRKNAVEGAASAPSVLRGHASNRPQVPFAYKLALDQWLLSLFNVKRFEDLAEHLRNEVLEGLDENNVHHFHHALTTQLFNLTQLPTDLLREYDQNIVRHTQRLHERRLTRGEQPIIWNYFQYLALISTEIYLDRTVEAVRGAFRRIYSIELDDTPHARRGRASRPSPTSRCARATAARCYPDCYPASPSRACSGWTVNSLEGKPRGSPLHADRGGNAGGPRAPHQRPRHPRR